MVSKSSDMVWWEWRKQLENVMRYCQNAIHFQIIEILGDGQSGDGHLQDHGLD